MKKEDELEDPKFNKMKINEQNVVCTTCGGTGRIRTKSPYSKYGHGRKSSCPHCKGTGQLDWISSIMRKEDK